MKKLLAILLLLPLFSNAITPIYTCGFECGGLTPAITTEIHNSTALGSPAISTSTFRTGARALEISASSGTEQVTTSHFIETGNVFVCRFYIRFSSLPSADCDIFTLSSRFTGLYYKNSDTKLYPGHDNGSVITFGSTGVTVTTGVWYRIDLRINISANPWTIDLQVDGTATAQLTKAQAANTSSSLIFGNALGTPSYTAFFDDLVVSATSGDYPIGKGFVLGYTVGSDGTHSGLTANDFERTLTGTDILNTTTDAYELINDLPVELSAGDWINMIAPVASTYVECVISASATAAPRFVEFLVGFHQAGTGFGTMEILLNDNGTTEAIYSGIGAAGTTTLNWERKGWADPPSAASAWTLSGNGNFNNIRIRFSPTGTVDANPDQYLDGVVFEAEFIEEDLTVPGTPSDKRHTTLGVGVVCKVNRFEEFKNTK